MTHANGKNNTPPQPDPQADTGAASAAAAGEADPVAALQRELDEAKSRLLRAAADYQNQARRNHRALDA